MKFIKLKYVLLLTLLSNFVYSQVVVIDKNDSISLKTTTNKSQYYLTIFNKENIKFNKKNGFKYDTIPHIGTVVKCESCEDESYSFLIEKSRSIPSKKYKSFSSIYLFQNIKKYIFGGNSYFKIQGKYYKNLGMPIE